MSIPLNDILEIGFAADGRVTHRMVWLGDGQARLERPGNKGTWIDYGTQTLSPEQIARWTEIKAGAATHTIPVSK